MCSDEIGNIHFINLNFPKRVAPTPNKDLCLGAGTVYALRIQNENPNGYVLLFITKHPL